VCWFTVRHDFGGPYICMQVGQSLLPFQVTRLDASGRVSRKTILDGFELDGTCSI